MIKVSVLYPNSSEDKFNIEYYTNNHVALVKEKLGDALKKISVEHGIAGGAPGTEATYIVMGHLYFDTVEDFQNAFGPHAAAIMGDVPNFTTVEPVIQISNVLA